MKVISTAFPQPRYQGPSKIVELSEHGLRERVGVRRMRKASDNKPVVTEIPDDAAMATNYWVVMLYANWSIGCLNFEGVLAKLSLKYSSGYIKFGKIDVDCYPDVAEEFGISTDPASFDLPTVILFCSGKETRRLPELTKDKAGTTNTTTAGAARDTITRLGWSRRAGTIVKVFELDKLVQEEDQNKKD